MKHRFMEMDQDNNKKANVIHDLNWRDEKQSKAGSTVYPKLASCFQQWGNHWQLLLRGQVQIWWALVALLLREPRRVPLLQSYWCVLALDNLRKFGPYHPILPTTTLADFLLSQTWEIDGLTHPGTNNMMKLASKPLSQGNPWHWVF